MKTQAPWHTDPQLKQLAGECEHWRQNRAHPGERIPSHLWEHAAMLAQELPRSRVAQHVRVSPSALNKHLATRHGPRPDVPPTPPRFVEGPLPPALSSVTAAMEIERERADGACLRLRCPESALPVAALVRAFLEGV